MCHVGVDHVVRLLVMLAVNDQHDLQVILNYSILKTLLDTSCAFLWRSGAVMH